MIQSDVNMSNPCGFQNDHKNPIDLFFLSFCQPWSCHRDLISSSKGMAGSQIEAAGRELGKLKATF